jgi:GAF domain-containing protein
MAPAPIPDDEEQRLRSYDELHAIDLKNDLKPFAAKVSRIFETPIAMLSLVDRDLQHFKAQVGLPPKLADAGNSSRETSICGHVVANDELIVVEDLARDKRFANNPIVKEHDFRFYAGAPVRSPDGQPIGSLCLIDTKPREFTDRERRLLHEYANDISGEIARAAANQKPAVG